MRFLRSEVFQHYVQKAFLCYAHRIWYERYFKLRIASSKVIQDLIKAAGIDDLSCLRQTHPFWLLFPL
jgi:hypothetical protein